MWITSYQNSFPPSSISRAVSRDTYYGPQCLEPVSFLRAYENLWELKNKIIDSKIQKENCKITVNV